MVAVLVRWTVMAFLFSNHGPLIAQHRAYASVDVEPDRTITRHYFWAFVNFIWFRRQVII